MKNLNDYKDEELGITIDQLKAKQLSAIEHLESDHQNSFTTGAAEDYLEYFKIIEEIKKHYDSFGLSSYLRHNEEIIKKFYGLIMEYDCGLMYNLNNMDDDIYIEAQFLFLSMIEPFLNDQLDLREALEEINFNLWTNSEFDDVFYLMDKEDEADQNAIDEWMMSEEYLIAESEHYAETGEEHFGGLIDVEGVLYKDGEICMQGV